MYLRFHPVIDLDIYIYANDILYSKLTQPQRRMALRPPILHRILARLINFCRGGSPLNFGAPWTPLSALFMKKWPRVRDSKVAVRKCLIIIRNALYEEY